MMICPTSCKAPISCHISLVGMQMAKLQMDYLHESLIGILPALSVTIPYPGLELILDCIGF